ncbi:MAG: carboxypeptidase regulatory-like domain-containing protein, partial [Bacteroidales bacterium]|nr:carboxypeptidase regulatory-like domain-containing protein [Bacteroidales bacterium]
MRKLFIPVMAVFLITAMLISSCKRDEYTEDDAILAQDQLDSLNNLDRLRDSVIIAYEELRDSLNHIGGIIQYSVNVVEASDGAFTSKSANAKDGLEGSSVTVSQYGIVETVVTGPSGIAVFSDLRVGTINVSVEKIGYTDVDFI